MSLVIPNKPSTTPPDIPNVVTGSGDLTNPGDTSNESLNAFNKRTSVPVTEEKGIDAADLKAPPHINVTAQDRVKAPAGNPDWVPRQFKEVARDDSRKLSVIVPTQHQGYDNPVS